jgi:phage FluMu protein Com
MPIRFRCRYCDQLLGIARRKIGTEVRCPECHKMVLVPAEDAPDVDEATRKGDPLFEGGDIDAPPQPFVAGPAGDQSKGGAAPTFSPAAPAPEPFDGEPYRLPAPVAGVVLSPLHAMLLTFAALTILALAFAVGLLVGRYLL